MQWFCNTDNHPIYELESSFLSHMKIEHNVDLDNTESDMLKDMFRRPSHSVKGTCNLCMRESKKLKSHIARHLQQLALFALPPVNEPSGSAYAERPTELSRTGRSQKQMNSKASDEDSLKSETRKNGEEMGPSNDDEPNDFAVDDDYEAANVPEPTPQQLDLIADNFSKARARFYRPLKYSLSWTNCLFT